MKNNSFIFSPIIILSLMIVSAIIIAGISYPQLAMNLVTNFSYPIIFAMSGLWVYLSWPFFTKNLRKNSAIRAAVSSLILTSVIFISVPPSYRVLSDETNLLSVSQSMHFKKDIANVTQAKLYYGNLNTIQGDLPTRPLLFPFFTSLIHTVSGYRYQNVFILNFLILFSLFAMTFMIVEASLGTWSAIASCLLLASIPTLTLSATSGGFDLCSLFFFELSLVFLFRFLKESTPENFGMLFINLIMLSQIRYESIAYVAFILMVLLLSRKISWETIFENSLVLSLTPFFLIPMFFQRRLTPNTFENPPGVPPFSIHHFFDHFKVLALGIFNPRPEYPFPSYLNWLAIAMLLIVAIKITPKIRQNLKPHQIYFSGILIGLVSLSLIIVLSHHFGIYSHPTQARLFLVFLSFLAMTPVIFRYFFPQTLSEKKLFAIAAVSYLLYHPVSTEKRFTNTLTIIRETESLYQFLDEQKDRKILLIAERPGQYTVANIGAVGFNYANTNHDSLLRDLNRGLMNTIWVFQKHLYETGRPVLNQNLDSAFQLEPVRDIQVTAEEFIRISKVSHPFYPVQPDKPKEMVKLTKLNPKMSALLEGIKFKD